MGVTDDTPHYPRRLSFLYSQGFAAAWTLHWINTKNCFQPLLRRRSNKWFDGTCSQQAANCCQLLFAMSIGQEAVVPYADKAVRQYVQQKSPNELVCWQHSVLATVTIVAISVGESHLAIAAANQAMIRDRHPMRVPAQVVEQFPWASERRFGVNHPWFLGQLAK